MDERTTSRSEAPLLAVAVAGISCSAPLAAHAVAVGVPGLAVACWRTGAAALLLWLVATLPRARTGPGAPASPRHVSAQGARRRAVLAGVLLAAHFGTWTPSLAMTSVASSVALVCTTPLWTAALDRLRGRPVGARTWVGTVIALAGVVVVVGVDLDGSPRALAGDLLALAGGVAMAAYLAVGRSARETMTTTAYTRTCYGTAALVLLAACAVAGVPLAGWAAPGWVALAGVVVCGQFLGHTLLNRALRAVGVATVAVVSLLEVPGSALVAALALGQRPACSVLGGVAVLLAGVAVVVWGPRQRGSACTR